MRHVSDATFAAVRRTQAFLLTTTRATLGVTGTGAVLFCALVLGACGSSTSSTTTTHANGPAPTSSSSSSAPVVPYGAPIKAAVSSTGPATDGTVAVGGTLRSYRLYVPASLPRNTPVPLLVALHGGLGSGQQFEQNSGFDGLAAANSFIVVYPNGTPTRGGSGLVWNAGSCCSVADESRQNVDDVGFISALVAQLEGRYDIARNQVFATGHSNGAMLAERLACESADKIVAIAVQAGALGVSTCHPSQPVAVLEIHGTADQNIPINGGVGSKSLSKNVFAPPVDALETFAANDRCPSKSTTSADLANRAVTYQIWHPCQAGTVVEWAKVTGANHEWMGHAGPSALTAYLGPPYMGFDSSAAVWSFLAAHGRS
jgi:polyhydroxybutyrate depolymerase